ncbi:MAG: PaaI family thioesterase [Beijerinckiaceae bacterium]|nr:PaaI family thioesterase [Beijerinckiaceae bacterium]
MQTNSPMPTFDPAADGWAIEPDCDFIDMVGPVWRRMVDASPEFAFLAEPRHRNRNGKVHGGMLLTFADQAMGLTASHRTGSLAQATVQLNLHFAAAVDVGDFVVARSTIARMTKSLAFMTCEMMVGDHLVATTSGIWRLFGR